MKFFLVLGGGITGLSSAFYFSKTVSPSVGKIVLLEGSNRLGGWLSSTKFPDGTVFDHGPRSIRSAGKSGINTLQLVDDLGLSQDVLPVAKDHPAAQNRYLYVKGKLCALPSSPLGLLVRQDPFSKSFIRQCWNEPFKKSSKLEDESIFDFFSRRFTPEIAQYTCDPMCRGIFAGDARKLSIKACFGDLFRYEQEYGSIVKGAIMAPKDKPVLPREGLVRRSREERWAMWSLSGGLQQLVDALQRHLEQQPHVRMRTGAAVTQLELTGHGKATVTLEDEVLEFDHVFATCPSSNLAPLLGDQHSPLSTSLAGVEWVHVGVVNLEYPEDILPVMGFGHLIPSSEDYDVLGIVYESCVFPQHNRPGQPTTRLTVMMGGAWFEPLFGDVSQATLNQFEEIAVRAVRTQLNSTVEPSKVVAKLHRSCIPQYTLGHSARVTAMESYIDQLGLPVSLLGASYRGVSVNDCILNARREVERVVGGQVGQA